MDSDPTSPPKDTREKGGQGSFVSFSKEKETMDRAVSPPHRHSHHGLLCTSLFSSVPPTPPSDPDSSCRLLEKEERHRLRRLLYRGKGDEGPRGLRLLRILLATVPLVFPLSPLHFLLPLLPHPPTSVLSYHPQWVDCCVFMFCLSPARLVRCVCYSAPSSAEFLDPWPCYPRG